jgi:hypothetical protein
MQVLTSKVRRPVPATGPDGHQVLSIWGRTTQGRALIVVVRPLSQWDWQIIGARAMTEQEITTHEAWEARRDGQ